MATRLAALIVCTCLSAGAAHGQTAPNLTRQQRDLLKELVRAVDAVDQQPTAADVTWQLHMLRASDGSHYIAVSVTPPSGLLPADDIAIYVRLATVAGDATVVAERSLVREWLQGSRVDPRMVRRSGMAIGEMPAMGAGAIGARGAAAVGSADLQALNLQRDRARQRRDDEEKKRREALEGNVAAPSNVLPFEDFEFGSTSALTAGTRSIQRAITAGPGQYDLFVAWSSAKPSPQAAPAQVARRSIMLGPATSELALSSVIIADRVGLRATPYTAAEQRAHPYSIGATDIVPSPDSVFAPEERLAAAFQIVNPAPDATGKPDIVVNLRVARLNGTREEPLASLSPLLYNSASLPPDFDVRLGHPLIAAMAVPLATIPRGTHRLLITVEDRLAKAVVSGRAEFIVIGSTSSLLAEAPPLGPRFEVGRALDSPIVETLIDRLTPAAPSPELARALALARSGRFAELLIEDRVGTDERHIRSTLTGIALLSLGDLGAIAQFERGHANRIDASVIDYLTGVARAMQGRDAEAIERWTAARGSGLSRLTLDRLLAEAFLRRRDFGQAAALMRDVDTLTDAVAGKILAAARIGEGRPADAVAILEAVLRQSPSDLDARWLLVHSLYADIVLSPGRPTAQFLAEARRYIDAKGRHSALAAEWVAVMAR